MDYSNSKVFYHQENKGLFKKKVGLALSLGKSLGSGGYGEVFETEFPDLVVKILLKEDYLTSEYVNHLKKLIKLGELFENSGLKNFMFPKNLICKENGQIIGFTMKKCVAEDLWTYNHKSEEMLTRKDIVSFATKFAIFARFLHNNGFLIGDISFKNLLYNYEKKDFYFIDVDSFILDNKYDTAFTVPFFVPEAIEKNGQDYRIKKDFIKSKKSEFYGITVLLYYILMRVEPYPSGGQLDEVYENNLFLKNWKKNLLETPSQRTWWLLPDYIKDIFTATLTSDGAYYQLKNRPSLDVWVEALKKYEEELPKLIQIHPVYGELAPKSIPNFLISEGSIDHTSDLKHVNNYYFGSASYSGTLKNGLKHGKGTITWANGDVYEGDWQDGNLHGHGTMKWASGAVYEGDFVNGKITGKGKKTGTTNQGNTYTYIGDFLDDHFHGLGKMTWSNGAVYEGDWKDNQRTGHGTMKWASGDVYEGDWQNGNRHGHGTYKWSDGAIYEGDWKEDKRTGHGTMKWASGAVYEGDFVNGKITGKGKKTGTNNQGITYTYVGDFLDGKYHGHGKMTQSNRGFYYGDWEYDYRYDQRTNKKANVDVYEGNWLNGNRHGQGTFKGADGAIYEGTWKEDKQTGKGKKTGTNNQGNTYTYIGDFLDGKYHGLGKMTWSDGDVYEGDWQNGNRHGHGTYKWSDGDIYEGEYQDGKLHGHGTMKWASGAVYEGDFVNGKITGKGKKPAQITKVSPIPM